MVSDAYFYAYQIPAISIILLGGIENTKSTNEIIDKIVEKSEENKFCEIQDLIKNAKTILSQREEKLRQKRNV